MNEEQRGKIVFRGNCIHSLLDVDRSSILGGLKDAIFEKEVFVWLMRIVIFDLFNTSRKYEPVGGALRRKLGEAG